MNENPYIAPTTETGEFVYGDAGARRIQVRPMSRLSDAGQLLGDQLWLFVGMSLVAYLINAVVPFNLLFGTLACGMHLCFDDRAKGKQTSFERLFKGFDHFGPSLVAMLIIMALAFGVMVPLFVLFFGGGAAIAALISQGDEQIMEFLLSIGMMPTVFLFGFISLAFYVPFLFTFALIADRKMDAWPAIKTSWAGARLNFWGLVWTLIVYSLLTMVAAMLCLFPCFLVIPRVLGGMYLIYRDIFPNAAPVEPQSAEIV